MPTRCSFCQPWLALLAAATLTAIVGCADAASESGLYRVAGKVTQRGEPLARGSIVFQAAAPNGQGSAAVIQGGAYRIAAAQGLPPGSYRVEIHPESDASKRAANVVIDEATGAEVAAPGQKLPPIQGAPTKGARRPPVIAKPAVRTVEVTKDGPNTFDFDLTN